MYVSQQHYCYLKTPPAWQTQKIPHPPHQNKTIWGVQSKIPSPHLPEPASPAYGQPTRFLHPKSSAAGEMQSTGWFCASSAQIHQSLLAEASIIHKNSSTASRWQLKRPSPAQKEAPKSKQKSNCNCLTERKENKNNQHGTNSDTSGSTDELIHKLPKHIPISLPPLRPTCSRPGSFTGLCLL